MSPFGVHIMSEVGAAHMDGDQQAEHRLLQYRWEDFKKRYSIAALQDDNGNVLDEGQLSDDDKRALMRQFTGDGWYEQNEGRCQRSP